MGRLWGRLWILIVIYFSICIVVTILGVFIARTAMGWEEITIYDGESYGSNPQVTPYSRYDSQTGRTSDGYIYDYRPQPYQPSPAERELERQELRREDWWRNDYKEWLESQGVDRGVMMGW